MKFKMLVIGLCLSAASPSWAAAVLGSGPGGASTPLQVAKRAAAVQATPATQIYTLVSATQSDGGDGSQTVPASTFTAVDAPNALTCPGPATCRIEAVVWASLVGGSTSGNNFGLCGFVDGVLMTQPGGGDSGFGCPFTGTVPADGSVTGVTQITAQSQIAPGKHTIQFKVYARGAAKIGLYVAEYRLYSLRSAQ